MWTHEPSLGQYRYFFVIVNALGSHSEVSVFTTRNLAFPKFLAILIRYRTHFPYYPIKYLQMDNAMESRSHTFEDYYVATRITLTYFVPYVHSLNGLVEAFIKKIQLTFSSSCKYALHHVKAYSPSYCISSSIMAHPSKHTHRI